MQAMIVTNNSDKVIVKSIKIVHPWSKPWSTMQKEPIIMERKAVLITVITRAEFNDFKHIMKQVDPTAFVSVSENVHILGRFVETDN